SVLEMNQVIFCIVLGFLISWGSIPVIRYVVSRRTGSNRTGDFHHSPGTKVPRFGGIALMAAFIVVGAISLAVVPQSLTNTKTRGIILISSLAMFGLGFWDDLRPLGARVKLL